MLASELAWTLDRERDGDLTRAVELLESARVTFRELGDAANYAIAGDRLIRATPKGPARDALRTTVLAEVRAAGRVGIECSILHSWADELFTAGRYAEAYERATDTVRCFEKTTDLGRMGRALVSLGRLERVHGQLDKALANYTRALALQEQVKDEAAAVQSLNALATTFSMQGRHEEAKAHYEQALARARVLGRPDLINALAGNLGGFYLIWGEYEKAASLLEPALRDEKQRLFISVRKRQLANAYQYLGRPDEAMKLVTEACDLADADRSRAVVPLLVDEGRHRAASGTSRSGGTRPRARPQGFRGDAGQHAAGRLHAARLRADESAVVRRSDRSARRAQRRRHGARGLRRGPIARVPRSPGGARRSRRADGGDGCAATR